MAYLPNVNYNKGFLESEQDYKERITREEYGETIRAATAQGMLDALEKDRERQRWDSSDTSLNDTTTPSTQQNTPTNSIVTLITDIALIIIRTPLIWFGSLGIGIILCNIGFFLLRCICAIIGITRNYGEADAVQNTIGKIALIISVIVASIFFLHQTYKAIRQYRNSGQ